MANATAKSLAAILAVAPSLFTHNS
jgi:hypothetical protein